MTDSGFTGIILGAKVTTNQTCHGFEELGNLDIDPGILYIPHCRNPKKGPEFRKC